MLNEHGSAFLLTVSDPVSFMDRFPSLGYADRRSARTRRRYSASSNRPAVPGPGVQRGSGRFGPLGTLRGQAGPLHAAPSRQLDQGDLVGNGRSARIPSVSLTQREGRFWRDSDLLTRT
jgi:hypothetical protein